MANGNGGRRAGAGRKPKAVRFAAKISAADGKFAAQLSQSVKNLITLADGGYETVETKWLPAGLIFVDVLHIDDDGKGTKGKRLAFPELDPQDLVIVERKVSKAAPDRASNTYIVDRVMGRPTAEPEPAGDGTPAARDVVQEMRDAARDYEQGRDPGGTSEVPERPDPVQRHDPGPDV